WRAVRGRVGSLLSYDEDEQKLHWDGPKTPRLRDALIALSNDPSWRDAITTLAAMPRPADALPFVHFITDFSARGGEVTLFLDPDATVSSTGDLGNRLTRMLPTFPG